MPTEAQRETVANNPPSCKTINSQRSSNVPKAFTDSEEPRRQSLSENGTQCAESDKGARTRFVSSFKVRSKTERIMQGQLDGVKDTSDPEELASGWEARANCDTTRRLGSSHMLL